MKEGTIYLRDCCVHFYFARVLLDALSVPPLGQVFTLCACHRPCDQAAIAKVFVEIRGKKIDFAHRSGALARPGSRELRAVIPASYDAWRPPERRKDHLEKIRFFGLWETSFSLCFLDFGGARQF